MCDGSLVLDAVLVSWDIAFQMRLVMEWFRLAGSADPNTFQFADHTSQLKWQRFITKYREASGQTSDIAPNADYIRVWIEEKGYELRAHRVKLNS
jgi:hypothetical protein